MATTVNNPGVVYDSTTVVGPASATNNAVAIFDGTTGKLLKNSTVTWNGTTFTIAGAVAATAQNHTFGSAAGSGFSYIILRAAAGNTRTIQFQSGTSARWNFGASSSAESTGDAGSDFFVMAVNDSAVEIDRPINILRASGGTITLGGTTNRRVVHSSTEASTSTTTGCATFAGGVGIAGSIWSGTHTATGNPGAAGHFQATSAAGQYANFAALTGTTARWRWGKTDEPETGSNAGSNFAIFRYDDAGTYTGTALSIARSTGKISLNGDIAITSSTASTSSSTGALTVSGGVGIGGSIWAGSQTHYFGSAAGSGHTSLAINAAAGNQRRLLFRSGSNSRWALGARGDAESTGDVGSNFDIEAYTDAAALIDSPISIVRASAGTITLGGTTSRTLATTGGRVEKVSTITGNTTLDSTYHNVLCNSASAFTVTLPAASTNSGRVYTIKNINTGTVTVDANASETIDGSLTVALAQYQSIRILCNGSNWFIL